MKLPLITEQRRTDFIKKKKKHAPRAARSLELSLLSSAKQSSLLNRLALYTVQTIPHALTNELVIRASKRHMITTNCQSIALKFFRQEFTSLQKHT